MNSAEGQPIAQANASEQTKGPILGGGLVSKFTRNAAQLSRHGGSRGRVVRIESFAPQRMPATVRATLNVASLVVLAAETNAAIRAGLVNHRAPLASPS